jgi:GNAT superfamily N-acetyltransferase
MRSPENVALTLVRGTLPPGLALLREEARAEGFRHLDRLAQEWGAGTVRFDGPGESLLAAHHDGELVGVGGVTAEPCAGRYRMRRFYVRPLCRHRGIGSALAREAIGRASPLARELIVRAGAPDARAFWEKLGFAAVDDAGHTHVLVQTR